MSQASELIASQVGSAISNQRTWGSIIFNVKDPQYGAKGDGIADDTNSVQAAVNDAVLKNATLVFLPPGTYKVTALTNTSTIKFVGDNATFVGYGGIIQQFGVFSTKNLISPVFNVVGYGADPSGVQDSTAAINSAVTAAIAAGGGIVYLPPGTYLKSGAVNLSSNIVLKGAGKDITILKAKNNVLDAAGIAFSNFSTNVYIEDLTIDGNKINQTIEKYGILTYKCSYCEFRNVKVINQKGIGMGFSNSHHMKIIGCEASYSGNYKAGFWAGFDDVAPYNSGFIEFIDCDAHYNDLDGIDIDVPNSTVRDCRFTYNGQNVPAGGALGAAGIFTQNAQSNLKLINNYCAYNTEYGINGIFVDSTLDGNTCFMNALSGIDVRNTSIRARIINNICNVNGNSPTTANPTVWGKAGIQFDVISYCIFTGNTCIDYRASAQKTQVFGLQCMNTGNSNFLTVTNNNFKFNKTDDHNIGSAYPATNVTNLSLANNI